MIPAVILLAVDRPKNVPQWVVTLAFAGDVHFDARVELAEISGSDSFIHVTSRLGPLVAQLVGVHRFELGAHLTLHLDARQAYVFDAAGRLAVAPRWRKGH